MTENEKQLVIKWWNSGETISSIAKMLPYREHTALKEIRALKKDGTLKGHSGKTQETVLKKMVDIYLNETKDKREIAKIIGLDVRTVQRYLRKAPIKIERSPRIVLNGYNKSEKTKNIIKQLQDGKKQNYIAEEFGVSKQYVSIVKHKFVAKKGEHDELQTAE